MDTTARGLRKPQDTDVWDSAGPWRRLADDVDSQLTAVEAAAAGDSAAVQSALDAHAADTTGVHGIADTAQLVTHARTVSAGAGLTGGGDLSANRTLAVSFGTAAGTAAQGNDARLSDTRTPTDGTVTTVKIVDGAVTDAKLAGSITPSKITGTAVVQSRTVTGTGSLTGGGDLSANRTLDVAAGGIGTAQLADGAVTDAKLAGSITPSKVAGTAVVQSRTVTGTGALTGGGDLSANRTLDVAAGGIGTAQLANLAVTTAKIADGAVTLAKLSGTSGLAVAGTVGNLLDGNVSSGTGLLGTTAGFGAVGVTLASTLTDAHKGTRSLECTATNASPRVTFAGDYNVGAIPVVPGQAYTASCWVKGVTVAGAHQRRTSIYFFKGDGTASAITPAVNGPWVTIDGTWREAAVWAVAPADAVTASTQSWSLNATVGDVFLIDSCQFNAGTGGTHQDPGVPTVGLHPQRSVLVVAGSTTWSPIRPVLEVSGTVTVQMPVSAGVEIPATVVNDGAGTVTIFRGGTDLISGQTAITIPGKGSVVLIPDAAGWTVASGSYSTSLTGRATYVWDGDAPGWRLAVYDSGTRSLIGETLSNGWTVGSGVFTVRRTASTLFIDAIFSGTSATGDVVFTLPAGFRPAIGARISAHVAVTADTSRLAEVTSAGVITIFNRSTFSHYVSLATSAASALPASLPGTQAIAPI